MFGRILFIVAVILVLCLMPLLGGCAVEGFSYSMGLDINKIGTKDTVLKSSKGETATFADPPPSTRNTKRSHDTGPNLFD